MKTNLLILGLLAGSSLAALAQPALEKKSIAENPKVSTFKIDTISGTKLMKSIDLTEEVLDDAVGYTIETKASVDKTGARGLTVEARDAKKMGFRIAAGSEDGIVDFTNPSAPSVIVAGVIEEATPVYRYAVKDGKVYVYKDGAYKGETSMVKMTPEDWMENGDFESTPDPAAGWWLNWTSPIVAEGGRTGKSCIKTNTTTGSDDKRNAFSREIRDLMPGKTYDLSFWVKKEAGENDRFTIEAGAYENNVYSTKGTPENWNNIAPQTTWSQISKRIMMPADGNVLRFHVYAWNGNNVFYYDDFSLTEVDVMMPPTAQESKYSEDFELATSISESWSHAKSLLLANDGGAKVLQLKERTWCGWEHSEIVSSELDIPVVPGNVYKLKTQVKSNSWVKEFVRLSRVVAGDTEGTTKVAESLDVTYDAKGGLMTLETPWLLAKEGDLKLAIAFSMLERHREAQTYLNIDKIEVIEGTGAGYVQHMTYGKSTLLGSEKIQGDYFTYDLTGAYAPTGPNSVEGNVIASSIYYSNGKLYTNGVASQATVYSTVGAAVQTVAIQADGTAAIDLAQGIYVVKVGDKTVKIAVK